MHLWHFFFEGKTELYLFHYLPIVYLKTTSFTQICFVFLFFLLLLVGNKKEVYEFAFPLVKLIDIILDFLVSK